MIGMILHLWNNSKKLSGTAYSHERGAWSQPHHDRAICAAGARGQKAMA